MRLLLSIGAAVLFAWPASAEYSDAPWRATTTTTYVVRDVSYTDTLRIWIDRGARSKETGRYFSWHDTQLAARHGTMGCSPLTWDSAERNRYLMANMQRDKNYVPLRNRTFLVVSIDIRGTFPYSNRPAWRTSGHDCVVVRLRDGRTLHSEDTLTAMTPHSGLHMPGGRLEFCMQLKAMLEGRVLYTAEELKLLWDKSPLYADQPRENSFLVPILNQDEDFQLKDIAGIRACVLGEWVDLLPQGALAQTTDRR